MKTSRPASIFSFNFALACAAIVSSGAACADTASQVYVPITPCRILETRNYNGLGGAGPLLPTAPTPYNYGTDNTSIIAQDGNPMGCGIPSGISIVSVSIAMLKPGGTGDIRAWSPADSVPTAAVGVFNGSLLFGSAYADIPVDDTGTFNVQADNASVYLAIDVFGYWLPLPSSGTGGVNGSGTINFLAKWTPSTAALGASRIVDDGFNIGIGISSPTNLLQIGSIGSQPYGGQHIAFGDGTNASAFLQSSTFSWWSSDTAISLMPSMGSGGNVGINTTTPASRLQIGSVGSTSYSNDDIAFGNGTNASGLAQTATAGQWYSTTNILLMPKNGVGDVGIGVTTPANLLQIGSVGSSGFSGNQFAFGNGTNASAMNQSNTVAWWLSTTDMLLEPNGNMTLQSGGNIFLMPNGGNKHGRVGINTVSPSFPLEVDDTVSSSFARDGYLGSFGETNDCSGSCPGGSTGFSVAILGLGDMLASGFDTFSDARIKNVRGVSDSAHDLATLEALEVTDYTMKDRVKYGNRGFKKMIAQQVEKIYPQVVSRHTDFIPNVYQVAHSVEAVTDGYRLHFDAPHGIAVNAKKLKVLPEGFSTMQQVDILALPSDREVIVKASGWTAERAFVYGEQVDDFRTIDYEGLTTLNISATQQLSKELKGQMTAMQELRNSKDAQIADLRSQLDAQHEQIAAFASMAADLRDLKAQLAALKKQRIAPETLQTAMQP